MSATRECTCRGYDPVDPCGHGDTSEGCPRHDSNWEPDEEGPTCGICDAVGHGFPGGGPCPLEERGWEDAERDRLEESR
jgi:hypothetical protein